jgi:hypothetical protein
MMDYGHHDQALAALDGIGPELRNGAPNHAPMVVEALAALGRSDAAEHWIDANRARFAEGPKIAMALGDDWQPALGDFGRLGEWENRFRIELAEKPRRAVLDRWLPRLIPGSMAAGTHGMIRCGHAVRALEHGATTARLDELARALAYCAARYRTMSSAPRLVGKRDLESAMHALPLLAATVDRDGPPPRIVKQLDGRRDFAAAVDDLTPPTDDTVALAQLAEIGARLYLRNAGRHPLVLLHVVTGPAAVQLLVGGADAAVRRTAFAYIWQAVAAWAAAFGRGLADLPASETRHGWDEIVARAVESGDEHAIKLTEACRRLSAQHPSPAFRAAAVDWVDRLGATRSWSPVRLVAAGIKTRLPAA